MKDQLYLLKPDFMDQGAGPFFCPGCAMVAGMLAFYPFLRDRIELHFIDFQRPRQEIITILGAENQGMPKLIVENAGTIPEGIKIDRANGRQFISGDVEICRYLAKQYGCGMPHS